MIVGARPTREVRQLAALPGVSVTGTVADVRPYLAHARAAVAPLRIARGVQNKVLEAMAIVGYCIGADKGYIYIRAEYPLAIAGFSGDGARRRVRN